jgi:hypothetical protein
LLELDEDDALEDVEPLDEDAPELLDELEEAEELEELEPLPNRF